ncbi:MAG: nucleotidyltransferase family protein [Acidobacteria bacterium]|nr:nucleotidyltransferase family protein [Acidobacteriota bacterium]
MTLAPGIELPAAEVARICRRFQVKELSLFGSVARGELRPDSDIDLLVEFLPGAPIGLFELWEMGEGLESLLGRRVDLAPKGGLKPLIRLRILQESRLLYAA